MTASRTPTSSPTLREQVLRGSVYLGARQVIGMGVSLAGAFLLMRTLGPREYGFYAAGLGFFISLQLVSQLGIGVYLIRREEEPSRETLHRAATLLVLLGSAGLVLGALTLPLATRWSRLPEVALPTLALYLGLPLSALTQVPMALLDRRLDYRRVAWIEVGGQIAFYVVAVGFAVVHPTVWAPVLGWWTLQLFLLFGACRGASYVPRPAWDRRSAEEMIRYGLGYSAAIWFYQLRRAVNPLVVGRYLGAEAVGVVSLTFQLVVQLSFVAVSAWRLSTAALARVQGDRGRLLRAVEEGMRLQVPAVAPFLLLFAWLGPSLVPLLLGPEWRQVPELFPYVAGGFLFSAVFTMQSSALFVIRRNVDVGAAHLLQLILLAVTALAFVPALGLAGWGLAELAMIAGFLVLHQALAREIGAPRYGKTLWLAAACALAMFTPALGAIALVPMALVTLLAQPWRDLLGAVQALRAAGSETRA